MMWKWNDGTDYLMHHGIKGQKWGVRNYQYEDGTLTPAGKERYNLNQFGSKFGFHSRKKKVGSSAISGIKTAGYSSSSSVTGYNGYAGVGSNASAAGYMKDLNLFYKNLKSMSDEEFIENVDDLLDATLANYVKNGLLTKKDILDYAERLAYSVGAALKENPKDFNNALTVKGQNEYDKLRDRASARSDMKTGITSRGYNKVMEK